MFFRIRLFNDRQEADSAGGSLMRFDTVLRNQPERIRQAGQFLPEKASPEAVLRNGLPLQTGGNTGSNRQEEVRIH